MKKSIAKRVCKKVMSFGLALSMVASGMVWDIPSPKKIAYADSGYNLYFGNFHAHTSYSDGTGTPEEAFKHMKESGAGDFGAITDHSEHLKKKLSNWEKTKELQDKYTDDKFVAIAGCEVQLGWDTGEMCTYNLKEIVHVVDAPKYYDWLNESGNENSIAQFNHPLAYDNEFYDFDYWSKERNNHIKLLEYSNADWDNTYLNSYIKALNKGWKVAPSANSDTHKGKWLTGCDNRTVVLAKKLTREDIFDAVRNRRAYATEDKNLRISYTINGEVMGQILYSPASLQFNINVESPSGNKIKKLELYADGKVIDSKSCSSTTADWSFTQSPNYGYYFVKVTMNDKKTAVTAPIWIDKTGAKPQPTQSSSPVPTTSQPTNTSTSTNLALNKNATCSSIEEGTSLVAKNVTDGSTSTRWGSEEGKSNPEWVQVDLGSTQNVNKVRIKWEDAYATAYQVQVSTNGSNYTTVANVSGNKNTDTTHEFNTTQARYVRIYCTSKATKYGYSIYEVEVYGNGQATTQPTTTPTPTVTPTPTQSTTPAPTTSNNGWGEKVFAPYVQLSSSNVINVNDVYNKTGQKYYTFAFMNNNNGTPAWRGKYNYDDGRYDNEIATLRKNGGDIIISFGGANTKEMAAHITDVTKLQQAYQKVIDRFNLKWMDLDIEGSVLSDTSANTRRNKAVVGLQKDNPDLTVAYCLPADPEGLSSKAVSLLKDAIKQGVRVDVVNVMAMDYGDSVAPNPEGKMGYYAIKTAQETKKQLEELGLNSTKVGITAMIGMNDETSEIFRVSDARELLEWANQTDWVRLLSFWSVNRDNGDGSGEKEANDENSSISQSLYEFTNVFKAFNKQGNTTPQPTQTSTPAPTTTPRPTQTSTPVPTTTPKPTQTSTPAPTTTPSNVNLALNKNATCSSIEEGTDLVAKNVTDGSTSTRWGSEEGKSNPEWVQIDLGNVYNVSKVNVKWEDAYAKAFQVQVSTNGSNYTTVANVSGNKNLNTTHQFNATQARYVRIYCTSKATKYGYSIYEVEVYGNGQATTQPTVTPTPTQTSTPAPTTTSTPITTNNGWGEKVFAPYVQLSSGNKINVNDVYNKTGQKYFTFAFMNNNNGTPAWKGSDNYDKGTYDSEIATLRKNGGDIIISFGGAGGKEMGAYITDATKLQQAYQKVIDRFDLKWMDLDIEGSILSDTSANTRRNKAIAGLQKNNPDLTVAYCLPADPEGLESAALNLLKDAKKQGVRVDVVNVMAMDYGDGVAPNPDGKMGYYAIKTAQESKKQIEKIGLTDTKIGVTAMIGVNDVTSEVFKVSDAKEVLEWANQTDWVRLLSFWSVNRDNGNGSGKKSANDNNSGISQSLYEFTNVYKSFNKQGNTSTATPTPTQTSTPAPTTTPKPTQTSTPAPTTTPSNVNLALNKNATCSSIEEGTDLVAKNVTDGSTNTRWGSEEGKSNPEWVQVDLGSTQNVNKVRIKWEDAYATAYQVQVSTNGSNYTTVANVSGNKNTDTTHEFNTTQARYVRIYCTSKATKYGYSIYEVEVYNSNGSGATQPTTTPRPTQTSTPAPTTTPRPTQTSTPAPTTQPQPTSSTTPVNGANVPFPQSLNYNGVIKPNNVTQAQMNSSIQSYYDYWKKTYVKQSSGKTSGGGYYVGMKGTGGDGNEITTSEAHGYGMLIFAYMAGYDKDAKKYFDGMYNMYDKHRSTENNANMSWVIDKSESTSKDSDSATDGDLDIAFALLLADKQWGSNGSINYLAQAKNIINKGIKGGDVDTSTYRVKLGDWQSDKYNTRASDWMTDHFSAYQRATGDSFWSNVNSTIYSLVDSITKNYASKTGLMPDFIVGSSPKPASANFLEASTDGDYSWNSCRYPWRISLNYITNGDEKSKAAATKVADWVISSCGGDVSKIYGGYKLSGTKLTSSQESAFTAPFVVAATLNSKNQDFVNKGWSKIANWKDGYYGDSINLLCQLAISGNYWAP